MVTSLKNTLFYAVMAVPLEVVFALVLALLLNRWAAAPGVPHRVLPTEDDAGSRDRLGLLAAAERQHRCRQRVPRRSSASPVRSG